MTTAYEMAVFKKFMPTEAVGYCHRLYAQGNFKLKIVNGRNTKLGDFRYEPANNEYIISVNNNLNPYAFVITYVHEVAHYHTYLKFKKHVKPHGDEWKAQFRNLMAPVIQQEIFPFDLKLALINHLKNPKAATCSDPRLYAILKKYDPAQTNISLLNQIKTGETFKFKNRIFQKEGKRRTRAICFEPKTGGTYLIPEIAQVERVA